MIGGDNKKYDIPKFKNNPFVPTIMKSVEDTPPAQPIQPAQPVQPTQPTQQKSYKQPSMYIPGQAQPPIPNQILNLQVYEQKPQQKQQQPAIQPIYILPDGSLQGMRQGPTIVMNGISAPHDRQMLVHEGWASSDKKDLGSYESISQRLRIFSYISSDLFPHGNGYDIPLDRTATNLLSHIKIMDLNPYISSMFSTNPYRMLPYGFLLYRSCYPIRFDSKSTGTICAMKSQGINMRIYKMTEGSYHITKNKLKKKYHYDEWRDIEFYSYIKEYIIKKKVCPNFAMMYGYNITQNSGINFDNLKKMQQYLNKTLRYDNGNRQTPQTAVYVNNRLQYQIQTDIRMRTNNGFPTSRPIGMPPRKIIQVVKQPTLQEQMDEMNKYTGTVIVCLTEAYNYSFLRWAKKTFEIKGNRKIMVNPAVYDDRIWYSVLFQIMAGLYVMQKHNIVINNFNLDRNIFIKDIQQQNKESKTVKHWKYKIEGIDYYVPNYGYLVIFDSNFRDYDDQLEDELDEDMPRKIDGMFSNINDTLTKTQCMNKIFNIFKDIFNTNIFDKDFINDDGVKPSSNVLQLLTDISDRSNTVGVSNDISLYIERHMNIFFNNRVGDMLKVDEIKNKKVDGVRDFYPGQIIVKADRRGFDRFVIFIKSIDDDTVRIITRDNDNMAVSYDNVPITSLNEYSNIEPLKQNPNIMDDLMFTDETLIESYTIN